MNKSIRDRTHNPFITTAKQLLVESLQIGALEEGTILGVDYWGYAGVLEHFLEGGGVRIGEKNRSRESGKHNIANLDAGCGDGLADGEVVCAKELREVMEEKQEYTENTLLESAGSLGHCTGFEERGGEVQESQKEAMESRPTFSVWRDQHLG